MPQRRSILLTVLAIVLTYPSIAQMSTRLTSPSGNLQASIFKDPAHHLAWSLNLNDKPLILPSPLGIEIKGADLGQDITLGAPSHSKNAYLIPIKTKNGVAYTLECRIFDNGFAFRYLISQTAVITGESTSWHIPNNSKVWYQENVYYYEGLHYETPIESLGDKQIGPPVTYQTEDGNYAAITEAALYNYSGMSLRSDTGNTLHAAFINDPNGWTIPGTVVSPWRVTLAANNLNTLVNSHIIPDLNPAPDSTITWVKPGRAVWSYFVHDNVTTLSLEKTYVDNAEKLGFEYSIVDAGWDSSWPNALDSLRSLVHYAQKRHIGIFVWKSYASLKADTTRNAFFRSMHKAGVAGLKIDYIDKEGIDQVRFYEKALRDGLKYHLLIDFHGANKPTGYNHRFPNEINREGIYGQEWRTYTPQGAINNAIIPFTRFLAGPADYTPGVFTSSLAYGTSRAQQLALPVIYNEPLLCWADDPARYIKSPAANIIRTIPTTWDETRVLSPSRIGELVAFARRKGKDWFIAVINAGDEKQLTLPLSFLKPGHYKAEIISDDLTNSDNILHSITTQTKNDSIKITLKTKGGFVARLTPTTQPDAITIQPAGGYLLGPQQVRIVANSQIRYTTDGSTPNAQSKKYTGPITITEPALLRARGTTSDVIAQFLLAPAPSASPEDNIFIGHQSITLTTNLKGEIHYTTDGSDPTHSSPPYTSPIVLDTTTIIKSRIFFKEGGKSELSNRHFQKVIPEPVKLIPDAQPGMSYAYYEGKWDSMPNFQALTPKHHGHTAYPILDSLQTRANEYGLQFQGWITIPETGVYTFYTVSDDGSQLYIEGKKVVDNDGNHGDLERSGTIALAAGPHPFTLNYFQNGSGPTLQVFIKGPTLPKQPIPSALFSF